MLHQNLHPKINLYRSSYIIRPSHTTYQEFKIQTPCFAYKLRQEWGARTFREAKKQSKRKRAIFRSSQSHIHHPHSTAIKPFDRKPLIKHPRNRHFRRLFRRSSTHSPQTTTTTAPKSPPLAATHRKPHLRSRPSPSPPGVRRNRWRLERSSYSVSLLLSVVHEQTSPELVWFNLNHLLSPTCDLTCSSSFPFSCSPTLHQKN